jgi:hemoglobin-like flavoprotein
MAGTAAAGVFQSLGNVVSGVLDFFTGKQTKGPIDILKDLIAIAPSLPKLSQPLDMIANAMNEADITNMVDSLTKIATAIKATAIQGAQDPNVTTTIDRLRELSKMSFKDQIEDLEAIAKAYNKIADTTNKINVEAMDSTTNMFKALAYLSQNGGKTAIEALGENLIEAVEELASMISDFEGTVKDQSASNRGVAEQFGGLTDSIKSSVGSFLGGGGSAGASPAENNAEVARQMRKLVKMLQSGDAKIVIADVNDSAAQKLA